MKASLNVLSEADGRKVAILGNMYELGDNEAELHRQVGEEAARLKIDEVICIGDLAQNIADAAKSGCNIGLSFLIINRTLSLISVSISNPEIQF